MNEPNKNGIIANVMRWLCAKVSVHNWTHSEERYGKYRTCKECGKKEISTYAGWLEWEK